MTHISNFLTTNKEVSMTEQEMMKNEDEIEINLGELFTLLKAQYKLIIISTLVTTIVAGVLTVFFISIGYYKK